MKMMKFLVGNRKSYLRQYQSQTDFEQEKGTKKTFVNKFKEVLKTIK